MPAVTQLPPNCAKGSWITVVAVDVAQQAKQLVESGPIDTAVFLQTVMRSGAKLIQVPAGFCDADSRHIERPAFHHRLKRREDFLGCQVTGRAEKYQGIGMRIVHGVLLRQLSFRLVFPGDRRTGNAWPIAACPHSPPRRAS